MPPTKFQIKQAQKKGKRYKIKPSDLLDLMQFESNFTPGAVSSADAQGLTQFIPSTAAAYGVKYGTSKKAQKSQIKGAAKYLTDLGWQEDIRGALAGYYGAPSPYADELLNQHIFEKYDKGQVKAKGVQSSKAKNKSKLITKTKSQKVMTQPAISYRSERAAAKLAFVQEEDKDFSDYANIASTLTSLKDQKAQYTNINTQTNKRIDAKAKDRPGSDKGKPLQGNASSKIVQLGKMAQQMGLSVGEHPKFGGVDPVHTTGSFHYSDRAIDVSASSPALMAKFAKRVDKRYGPKLAELFWNGQGAINRDNGVRVPVGFVDGHTTHVHVAI